MKPGVTILKFIVVLIFVAGFFGQGYILAPSGWTESQSFIVKQGDSATSIASKLEEQGLIRSEFLFRFAVKISGTSSKLKTGSYVFQPVSMISIIQELTTGPSEERITIPEGMRARDIAQLFTNNGLFVTEQELEMHEGYLFPNTYFISKSSNADEVVRIMRDQFDKEWEVIAPFAGSRSMSDIVIMASILEKEASVNDDSAIIAGILWKRLENSMRLQVDATLKYERGLSSSQIALKDLETDSLYNTYTRDGLPPTPIGNPGAATLLASASPKESHYWFYLHDNEGNTYFAKTFEEHKANKRKYLTN